MVTIYCFDCPDHEACSTGYPCWMVKEANECLDDKDQYHKEVQNLREVRSQMRLNPHAHITKQHRDGKLPWCEICGLTADYRLPSSILDRRDPTKKGNSMADMPVEAKIMIVNYFNERVEKTDDALITISDVYVVWFSKILQNWKALVSTTVPDGMYYEVTHNGNDHVTYIDAYKKFDNVAVPD